MKFLDEVIVKVRKREYEDKGVLQGFVGTIILAEIRDNKFFVEFCNSNGSELAQTDIDIEDIEVIKSSTISNQEILAELPNCNPKWWCKVEDGFIVNLLGEKKNKIPYDYNS